MKIPIYQVDAFASHVFAGNPAAICPLTEWLPTEKLQAIAAENNLSETAFLVRKGDHFDLRWMTPEVEVDLCGHATLAAAYVIFRFFEQAKHELVFESRSGELRVKREGDLFVLDFPARPPESRAQSHKLAEALGAKPMEVWGARDLMAVFETEAQVRALAPDMRLLKQIDTFAVIVTAKGQDADFVSRFFAPGKGIDEDPVTGSAHCTLIPFWAARLGRHQMRALQVSKRGGELFCEYSGNRVLIGGRAALYLTGEIEV
jgi:PhzF family phenazine biosynthesis protein